MTASRQGMSIQSHYRLYRDGSLTIKRQYQRKLVWTVAEKQKLIDSLLKDYPLPLFLLAENPGDGVSKAVTYEVIDGMQRLNAIFRLRHLSGPSAERVAAVELDTQGVRHGCCGSLNMAPTNNVHHVRTIARVAEMLGEDEDWLWDVANEMDHKDGLIWVYGPGDDGVMAFTDLAPKLSPNLSRSTMPILTC